MKRQCNEEPKKKPQKEAVVKKKTRRKWGDKTQCAKVRKAPKK